MSIVQNKILLFKSWLFFAKSFNNELNILSPQFIYASSIIILLLFLSLVKNINIKINAMTNSI